MCLLYKMGIEQEYLSKRRYCEAFKLRPGGKVGISQGDDSVEWRQKGHPGKRNCLWKVIDEKYSEKIIN